MRVRIHVQWPGAEVEVAGGRSPLRVRRLWVRCSVAQRRNFSGGATVWRGDDAEA